jgi:hypothetical protein
MKFLLLTSLLIFSAKSWSQVGTFLIGSSGLAAGTFSAGALLSKKTCPASALGCVAGGATMAYGVFLTYHLAITYSVAYNSEEVEVAAYDAMQVLAGNQKSYFLVQFLEDMRRLSPELRNIPEEDLMLAVIVLQEEV